MKSFNEQYINTFCDDSEEQRNIASYDSEAVDPLQGLDTEATPSKCYRIDSVVFADPLEDISNEDSKVHKVEEETMFIDNVIVQKKAGSKYKKYHIHIENASDLKCPQSNCTRTFSSTKLLKAHIRKVHCADRSKYICERCGRGFSAQYLLERHAAVHRGEKVQCPVCNVMLSCRTGLSKHLRSHSNLRLFSCEVCNKSFARASNRATHVKFVHREGLLQCDECEKRFSSRKLWSLHMTTHRRNLD